MKQLIYIVPFILLSCGTTEEQELENTIEDAVENGMETEMVEIPEPESKTTYTEDCDNATFNQLLSEKQGLLIDVRTPEEYAQGHIPNAINIDYKNENFESIVDTLDLNTPTFVYCQGGVRSSNARDILMSKQFAEVYNLQNGYGSWEE
ncbi:MAG: rhodanese-like domain-containing protein [Crocinitomicaceae bacterium]